MPSVDDLTTEEARQAYQAFVDMKRSKAAHFNYLVAIEEKYKPGGAASAAENRELERLLVFHDKNVQAFKAAMSAVTDSGQLQILLRLFS